MEKCELCPMAGSEAPCAAWVPVRHEPFCRHLREGRSEYLPVIRRMSGLAAAWIAAGSPLATPDRPFPPPLPPPEPEGRWPGGVTGYEAPPGDGRIVVVISTRERPNLVGRAVASVLGQSRRPDRLVIVKNGPNHAEAYREALGPFLGDPTVSVLWEPDLGGIAGPINVGLRLTETEYAAVLDDDDEWEPDFLKELAGALDSDRSLGLAYCGARHPAESPTGKRFGHAVPPPNRDFVEAMKAINWFGWSQAVWRRELLAPDYLNPEAGGCADRDAWLRIGFRAGVYRVPHLLASHWWHGDNASLDTAWIKTGHQWVEREIKAGRYGTAAETTGSASEPSLPSWPRMAANFVGAQLAAAATGWQEVDAGTKEARLATCHSCDRYRPSEVRCSECGCYLQDGIWGKGRASLAAMACPIGKWPAYVEMENTNTNTNTNSGGKCGGCEGEA
jgi:hypothetical protein